MRIKFRTAGSGWAIILGAMCCVFLTSSRAEDIPKMMNGLPLVYASDFSKGIDEWKPTDPSAWKVITENGTPVYSLFKQSDYNPPVRSPLNISLVGDLVVNDVVIEAELKSTGRQYGHRDMCIIFGYQDESHFYYAHIAPAPNTDPHANSIFIVNGEPRKSIALHRNNGTEWKDETYYTVRVVRDTATGSIQVFHGNLLTPILVAEDKTFLSGKVGVGSFDDTGTIRSFIVWANK